MRIAILGAGNGGQAMAAHLTALGATVALWGRNEHAIHAITQRNGITVFGAIIGTYRPAVVSSDIAICLQSADLAMVVVPAHAHGAVARLIAPYLTPEQWVVLNPGRTGGALEMYRAIAAEAPGLSPLVAELDTFIYTCRAHQPGRVEVFAIKEENHLSAIPRQRSAEVLRLVRTFYSQVVAAEDSLTTGLNNMGAMLHPAPLLFNIGAVENPKMRYYHYLDGITPTVARFIEDMDQERVSVASAYGARVDSLLEWLLRTYGVSSAGLHEAILQNKSYATLFAPQCMNHRYVLEEIPTGLVPMSELARAAGVRTPCINALIELGERVMRIPFRRDGRNLVRLGLDDAVGVGEIRNAFRHGSLSGMGPNGG